MMLRKTKRFLFILLFGITSIIVKAQPQLPEIAAVSQQGVNYISWTNPYDGLKAIAVQRSANGQNNFRTIGYIKDLKKGVEQFIDTKPENGVCFYRLLIVFNSEVNWFSDVTKLDVEANPDEDMTEVFLAKEPVSNMSSIKVTYEDPEVENNVAIPLPNNNQIPSMRKVMKFNINTIEEIEPTEYKRSEYVYYNTTSGFIQIQIPYEEEDSIAYTIDFFDNRNYRIIRVPNIHQPNIMLDKRNFQRKGLYRFELKKNEEMIEEGYLLMN